MSDVTRRAVDVDPSWSIGGKPHGGYLLATMVEAALDAEHPHPMAVSAHYVASPSESAAVVEVERLRTGRRVASSRVRLLQDDAPRVEVLLSTGRWSDDAEPFWAAGAAGPPELPPVTFDLGLFGWVPTLELTVLLRGLPAPGWIRAVQRATLLQDGWLDEECLLWDSRGRLVAQARQLAGYRTA